MKIINIARGNPDSSQDGSALWPYRATTAVEFDRIFQENRGPTLFLLAPGTYFTRGAWAFAEENFAIIDPNSSIIGVGGSEATRITLGVDYEGTVNGQDATYIEALIGGNSGQASDQMGFGGFTLDLSDADAAVPVSGIHAYSSGCTIADVRVVGVTGEWGAAEGFGLLVNEAKGGRGGGSKIVRCRVEATDEEDTYVTGIYLGSLFTGGAPNAIEDCHASYKGTPVGKRAHAGFAANENTTVRGCTSAGFDRFLFCDTGNVGDLDVSGCRAEYGYCAIDLPAPASANNRIEYRRRIRVSGCTFLNAFPSTDHAIGILLQDKTDGNRQVKLEDVDVYGCRFSSALTPAQFYAVSIMGLETRRVWVRQNQFPAGCQTRGGVWPPTPQAEVIIEDVPAGEG